MSAPAFTPGPWTWTDESSLTPDEPYWIGSDHPEVGRCTFATVRSGCDEADELGDMLANAHLIASAPALYEAAEKAVRELQVGEGNVMSIIAAMAHLNDALTLARGESQ